MKDKVLRNVEEGREVKTDKQKEMYTNPLCRLCLKAFCLV